MAEDASLPSGQRLAQRLHQRFSRVLGYDAPADTDNLIAVADAAFEPQGGERALQSVVTGLEDFTTAIPNYGHQVVALLLAEGAVKVLSWNWDTCIERATPQGEHLRVAKSGDEMRGLVDPQLAKVHGCATMPSTLLITSDHLESPPVWANTELDDRMRTSTIVFIGIGDVADYARLRITELVEALRAPDIQVVSPSIRRRWDGSVWKEVLPALADPSDDRRVELSADDFLDDLARAWAGKLLDEALDACDHVDAAVAQPLRELVQALGARSAVDLIRWCRSAMLKLESGESAIVAGGAANALLAAAALAAKDGAAIAVPRDACCLIGDREVEVLIVADRTPATAVRLEAERRSEILATENRLRGDFKDKIPFLVVGTPIGPLQDPPDVFAPPPATDDIIDGPGAKRLDFISATSLIQNAA